MKWRESLIQAAALLCLASPAWGQEIRAVEAREDLGADGQTRLERYLEVAVALACDARRFPGVKNSAQRQKAQEGSLRAHGTTRAAFARDSFDFGADPEVARTVENKIRGCKVERPLLSLGTYRYELRHARGLQGSLLLSVRQGDQVAGVIEGLVDGHHFLLEIEQQHLVGAQIKIQQQLEGGPVLSFEGNFQGSQLRGVFLIQEKNREDVRVTVRTTARR